MVEVDKVTRSQCHAILAHKDGTVGGSFGCPTTSFLYLQQRFDISCNLNLETPPPFPTTIPNGVISIGKIKCPRSRGAHHCQSARYCQSHIVSDYSLLLTVEVQLTPPVNMNPFLLLCCFLAHLTDTVLCNLKVAH